MKKAIQSHTQSAESSCVAPFFQSHNNVSSFRSRRLLEKPGASEHNGYTDTGAFIEVSQDRNCDMKVTAW